jgi:hypothetical protein
VSRVHFKLRDRDRGFARLMRQLRGKIISRLAVGVLERRGSTPNRDSDLSVLAVAIVHEFGGGNLPERSFIRAWADERHDANLDRIRRVARAVYAGANEDALLREIGKEMVDEIRARMAAGIDPPLKPATIAEKGSATPLVGGQLARAISSEVRRAS